MSESITIIVKKKKCESCKYSRDIYAQDGFLFIGCTHEPYKGKWVKEIKNCPMEEIEHETS